MSIYRTLRRQWRHASHSFLACPHSFPQIHYSLLINNLNNVSILYYTHTCTVKTKVGRAHQFVSHSTPNRQLVCWRRQFGGLCPPLFLQCKYVSDSCQLNYDTHLAIISSTLFNRRGSTIILWSIVRTHVHFHLHSNRLSCNIDHAMY